MHRQEKRKKKEKKDRQSLKRNSENIKSIFKFVFIFPCFHLDIDSTLSSLSHGQIKIGLVQIIDKKCDFKLHRVCIY